MKLRIFSPSALASRKRGDAAVLLERAARMIGSLRDASRGRFGAANAKLSALDPTAVLARGYAIATRRATGRAIRTLAEAVPGEGLDIRVTDGVFGAFVAGAAKRDP